MTLRQATIESLRLLVEQLQMTITIDGETHTDPIFVAVALAMRDVRVKR